MKNDAGFAQRSIMTVLSHGRNVRHSQYAGQENDCQLSNKKGRVYRDYKLHVDFNIDFEQFSFRMNMAEIQTKISFLFRNEVFCLTPQ